MSQLGAPDAAARLAAREPRVVGVGDLLSLLLGDRPRAGVTVQGQRVNGRTVGEADPVVVLGLLVSLSHPFDVFSSRDAVHATCVGNAVYVAAAPLDRPAPGA